MDSKGLVYDGEVSYDLWPQIYGGQSMLRPLRSLQKLERLASGPPPVSEQRCAHYSPALPRRTNKCCIAKQNCVWSSYSCNRSCVRVSNDK